MTIERRFLHGSVVGAISFLAILVQSVALVPVLLKYWGPERYGLWVSLAALCTLFQTIDVGHQTYVGNEFSKLRPVDPAGLKTTLASSLRLALFLGGVQLFLAILAESLGLLDKLLGGESATDRVGLSLLILVGTWFCSGGIGGILARLYTPHGLYARAMWWGIAMRVLQTVGIALSAVSGGGILRACIVSSAAVLVVNGLQLLDSQRIFKDLRPLWSGGNWQTAFLNGARSVILTGVTILQQLQNSGLVLAISSLLGTAMVPVLTTVRTMSNAFSQAAMVVTYPLIPDMVRYHITAQPKKLAGVLSGCWWSNGLLVNFGLVVTLPLVEPVYLKWTRGQIPFSWTLYLLIALSVSLKNIGTPLQAYLHGINDLRAQGVSTFVQSVIVIGGSAVLVSRFGLLAAGAAIAMGELVGSVLIPALATASHFRQFGGRIPAPQMGLALASVGVVMLAFLGLGSGLLTPAGALVCGACLLSVSHFAEWRALPLEVRARILDLWPPLTAMFAR